MTGWGKPYDSADARHMCSDRRAVWCGKCISLGCFEVHSRAASASPLAASRSTPATTRSRSLTNELTVAGVAVNTTNSAAVGGEVPWRRNPKEQMESITMTGPARRPPTTWGNPTPSTGVPSARSNTPPTGVHRVRSARSATSGTPPTPPCGSPSPGASSRVPSPRRSRRSSTN